MAQKKNGASRSTSGAKKPVSTARNTGGTKKTSAPKNGKSTAQEKKTASAGSHRTQQSVQAEEARKPVRRQVGCFVLLFFGLVAVIALFPAEGWLLDRFRTLCLGLFGWGYYAEFVCLLWGAYILGFHHGRPVQARLICVLLMPAVVGAFVHVVLFGDAGGAYDFSQLWRLALEPSAHCGGVISGTVGSVLEKSVSAVGAVVVLAAAFAVMFFKSVNMSAQELAEEIRNRPRLDYEPDDDETMPEDDEYFTPEDYDFPGSSIIYGKKNAEKQFASRREEAAKKPTARHRAYDEEWEQKKDRLFADMDIDPDAAFRIAAALEAEQAAQKEKSAEKPAAKPKKEKAKPAEKTAEKPVPAATTDNVKPLSMEEAADIAGVQLNSADMNEVSSAPVVEKIKIDKDAEAALVAKEIEAAQEEKPAYIFPETTLLNKSTESSDDAGEELDEVESQLQTAIRSFGVGASIVGAVRGPTVTRYELRLDQGVKLNKITNLAGDIALSLGVSSVRIAPIPDKISTVGVEVPNRTVKTVWLGDVIDSDAFRKAKSKLSFSVGKDIAGNVIIGNIAKMPHVLIAGTTGSGKSVCINSLILSLLYKSTPDEVKLIMIDPKMVELGIYNGMPHLYVPVVTDPKKAAGALQWSVVEMLKRYRLFSEVGVRDLAGYNQTLKNNDQPILPQVVIIIDELADLMMVASKEVEESICRVAQMGRAAGMHLVVATQRPSSDVITGLMKANIPSRIAFAVSSALESRIILDQQGAEKLIGAGDMLYSPMGLGKPLRVQGAFVTDEEREEIIEFIKRESEAEYSDEIIAEIEKAAVEKDKNAKTEDTGTDGGVSDYDELLPQAVDVIFETKQASVSMLQRRLKLGYSRAARLIDQLEEVGVVGPFEGSKPRQILLTRQQWQEMQYSHGTAPVDTIAGEYAQVSDSGEFADTDPDEPIAMVDEPEEDTENEDVPWDEEDEL